MRLLTNRAGRGAKARSAFTMVEIALSIAVVAFALVAIMGVLPTGMTVQKDNREDTLIAQEGRFWLEAIKSGSRGIDDLPSYIEEITVTNAGNRLFSFASGGARRPSSADIIAMLGMPRSSTNDGTVARVKAITGPAADKGTNGSTFRYQLRAEVTPSYPIPPSFAVSGAETNDAYVRFNTEVSRNLFEVRLVLRWPVVERGGGWYVGNNRKVFRGRIAGRFENVPTNIPTVLPPGFFRTIVPNKFNNG